MVSAVAHPAGRPGMWGRHWKRKRGGQLERQLALGRLEDALGEVDRAEADSAQAEDRASGQAQQQMGREQAEREEPEDSKVSSWRTRHGSFG
jgi:hypothetical protein